MPTLFDSVFKDLLLHTCSPYETCVEVRHFDPFKKPRRGAAFPQLGSELCAVQEFTSTIFRHNDAYRVNSETRQAAENNCRKINRRYMTACLCKYRYKR